jgi:tripartite motif-containing protein 71
MILRTNYFIAFLWLLQILLVTQVTPAGAIRLIEIKPLFEITDKLNQPSDVAVAKDGRIYVVNGVNNQIRIFNQNGKFLSAFGADGSAKGEFRNPLGIDVDQSGKVFVADSGNHRVQIFDPRGRYIAAISIPSKNNHPADPTDVVVDDSRQRCYVVDNDNHYILVYDLATLKLTQTYGGPGTDKGAFRYPFLMTLDKQRNLYIVDVINTRVQVLNPDGKLVAVIGGWGVEKGEFFRPKGVAIDKDGRVFVSDSFMGVIQVFDAIGTFYAALGNPKMGKVEKFKTPAGLIVDHRNRLYVVEMLANKVSVYQIMGATE